MTKGNPSDAPLSEPERDPWFNPYRFPGSSQRIWAIMHGVLDGLNAHENRKRARTAKDKHWLQEVLPALISDLTNHFLSGSPGNGLVVPRAKAALGKSSRYYPPIFTRSFPKLLDALERLSYLRQQIGSLLRDARTIETHDDPSGIGSHRARRTEKDYIW